eukprot:SM000005S17329  [mRNA]  locus=s5:1431783:1436099:- [translate_table: standard]
MALPRRRAPALACAALATCLVALLQLRGADAWIGDDPPECSPCQPGYGRGEGPNGLCGRCTRCPAGSSGHSRDECRVCPAGTAITNPADDCAPCRPGTFGTAPGSTYCTSCPAGTFLRTAGATGATSCLPCAPGSFSAAGAGLCTPCSAGTFTANPRSTSCAACPPGFTSAAGQTSCVPCPAGSTTTGANRTGCALCPPQTFAPRRGSPSCSPCPSLLYSAAGSAGCVGCPADTIAPPFGGTLCVLPCPCGMAWEFGCNRSLGSPSQAEFVTYTTYVATQQQVPILVALQCSLKAAIEQPALLPNLTQILDMVEDQHARNPSWQPDTHLRALIRSYTAALHDPAIGDPNVPSIVVPTFKLDDVEEEVDATISLLQAQDADANTDITLNALHDAEAHIRTSIEDGFNDMTELVIGVETSNIEIAVQSAKQSLTAARSTLAARQSQATSLKDQLATAKSEGERLNNLAAVNYEDLQHAIADASFWSTLTTIFKVATSVASACYNPAGAAGGLLSSAGSALADGGLSLADELSEFASHMLEKLGDAFQGLVNSFVDDPIHTLGVVLDAVEALQGKDLMRFATDFQEATGSDLPADLASLQGDASKAVGRVQDYIRQAVDLQRGSATNVVNFLSAQSAVDSWSQSVHTQFNGQCDAAQGPVKAACETYQGTLLQQGINNKLQLFLIHDLQAVFEQSAQATMDVLGSQQTVTNLMQQGLRWQHVLDDRAAHHGVVLQQLEEARRAAYAVTAERSRARDLARLQIGVPLMIKMIDYCQLLRYIFPNYGPIVDRPLCGLVVNGRFNLKYGTATNLAAAVRGPDALFNLRSDAAAYVVNHESGGALNIGQGLSLVKVGNPASPLPGIPIDLAAFKATGRATFRLDVSNAPYSLHDAAGLWPHFRFYSQMRVLGIKFYLEGATWPTAHTDPNCAYPVVGFRTKLRSPFQQWHIDAAGVSHVQSYHLTDRDTTYAYSPSFSCHSCRDPERDDICPVSAAGVADLCRHEGYAPWRDGEEYLPTPFAQWEIRLDNRFGCTNLDNVTDILLSMDLYGVDEDGATVPQALLTDDATYPDTLVAKPYEYFPRLCQGSASLASGDASARSSLCTRAQICSDSSFATRLATTVASQAASGVTSTLVAVADGPDHWVEVQDLATLCSEVVNPANNPQTAHMGICCAGPTQAPYTAATYGRELSPGPAPAPGAAAPAATPPAPFTPPVSSGASAPMQPPPKPSSSSPPPGPSSRPAAAPPTPSPTVSTPPAPPAAAAPPPGGDRATVPPPLFSRRLGTGRKSPPPPALHFRLGRP